MLHSLQSGCHLELDYIAPVLIYFAACLLMCESVGILYNV